MACSFFSRSCTTATPRKPHHLQAHLLCRVPLRRGQCQLSHHHLPPRSRSTSSRDPWGCGLSLEYNSGVFSASSPMPQATTPLGRHNSPRRRCIVALPSCPRGEELGEGVGCRCSGGFARLLNKADLCRCSIAGLRDMRNLVQTSAPTRVRIGSTARKTSVQPSESVSSGWITE